MLFVPYPGLSRHPMGYRFGKLAVLLLFSLGCRCGLCQLQRALCDNGNGRFETQFETGATVLVDAVRNGAFSGRTCSASIKWGRRDLSVVPSAAQVDIDVLGADFGFESPVAAFVIRSADNDWHASYAIYSLQKPVRLLRTLTGSDFYRTVDADFDGRIAIWTRDAAAIDRFDDLRYSDFDFPPTVVLRFEHHRLLDVSAEYTSHYDRQIAEIRAQLTSEALSDFRNSDGKLLDGSLPWPRLVALRKTKIKVLEIVSAWLYSGREQKAWAELSLNWPPTDFDRVRAALLDARAKGVVAQVDGVAPAVHLLRKRHPTIYALPGTEVRERFEGPMVEEGNLDSDFPASPDSSASIADVAPRAISLRRDEMAFKSEAVDLVIDAAGKVWSAKMVGSDHDPELLESAKGWTFIPAFKYGRAVACRDQMGIYPYR